MNNAAQHEQHFADTALPEQLQAFQAGFRAGLAAMQNERPAEAAAIDAEGVAELLGVSAKTVRRLNDGGKLPPPLSIDVGGVRWSRNVILDWIDAGCPDRLEWMSREEVRIDNTPRRKRRTNY
jgi:predicted DNA-binding transcriptional regulator AlpA